MHWLCQWHTLDRTILLQRLVAVAEEQEVQEEDWQVKDTAGEIALKEEQDRAQ